MCMSLQLSTLFSGLSGYVDKLLLNNIDNFLQLFELIFTESGLWNLFERNISVINLLSDLSFMNIIYISLCYRVKFISQNKKNVLHI